VIITWCCSHLKSSKCCHVLYLRRERMLKLAVPCVPVAWHNICTLFQQHQ
jgi:hypothetical protein